MRNRLGTIDLPAALPPAVTAEATERTASFTVEKMTCVLRPVTVKTAMQSVPGVTAARIDRKVGRADYVLIPAFVGFAAIALFALRKGRWACRS